MLDLSARRRSEASPARAWLKATHRPDFGVKVEDRLQELSQRRPIAAAPLSMTPITPVDLEPSQLATSPLPQFSRKCAAS